MNTLTVGIAGSTVHTVTCAEALRLDSRFSIAWVLTPPPQPLGRKHVVTPNPLETWAQEHKVPVVHVAEKITTELEQKLPTKPDFLLVVDFGYFVPSWLLQFPRIAPINVHPSLLPRWRGSSPGQFVMMYGEKNSAVTIMKMDKGLDTGPILWQGELEVLPEWNQTTYYQESFTLAAKNLPQVLEDFSTKKVEAQPQPVTSPTPPARRLEKNDGYVAWKLLSSLVGLKEVGETPAKVSSETSSLLQEIKNNTGHAWPEVITHAVHGLSPWPGVWTIMPTEKGWKRMKILSVKLDGQKITLKNVQLEGKEPAVWQDNGK